MMLSVFNCCVSVIGCCGKCCSCCVVVFLSIYKFKILVFCFGGSTEHHKRIMRGINPQGDKQRKL